MAKQKTHLITPKKDKKRIVIHIDKADIKVRKPLPPASQVFGKKKGYQRKSKHPGKEEW